MNRVACLFAILFLAACGRQVSPSVPADPIGEPAELVRVVDGDTIIVVYNGKKERVRFIAENAPELSEPGGPEAKAAVEKRLGPPGSHLRLIFPRGHIRDRYARLLATPYPG